MKGKKSDLFKGIKQRINSKSLVYSMLMLVACILVYQLFFLAGNNPLKSEEEAKAQDEVIAEAKTAYGEHNIIQGDVTDRNGVVLVTSEKPSTLATYKDPEAYTQAIGFSADFADYLLMGRAKDYLYDAKEDTDKGCTIQTTLDSEWQEYCYQKIKSQCKGDGSGDNGSVAILDAKTGAVLTWAYYPSFDVAQLNTAVKEEKQAYTKRQWIELVEEELGSVAYPLHNGKAPGSVFKILTSIAIIEMGQAVLDTPTYDGDGYYTYSTGNTTGNATGPIYEDVYFEQAFVMSLNSYFIDRIINDVGRAKLDDVAKRCKVDEGDLEFDFGSVQSSYKIDKGNDEDVKINEEEALGRTAIGQHNVQLTPIQVAMLTSAVINGGDINEPHMIQEIYRVDGDYNKTETVRNEAINHQYMTIMSDETAAIIKSAMDAKGDDLAETSGQDLIVNGETIKIGCKTGTAELDGAAENIWITSYAPAEDPQYVVVLNRYNVDSNGSDLYPELVDLYKQLFDQPEDEECTEKTIE